MKMNLVYNQIRKSILPPEWKYSTASGWPASFLIKIQRHENNNNSARTNRNMLHAPLNSQDVSSASPYQDPEHTTEWEQRKSEDGISIYTRKLNNRHAEWRETKAAMTTNQPLGNCIEILAGTCKIWESLPQMQSTEELDVGADGKFWVSYLVFDMPWPLKKQDLIVKCNLTWDMEHEVYLISLLSAPEYIPRKKGVKRIEHFDGTWSLQQSDLNVTQVEYVAAAAGKSPLPRWVTEPIVHNNLIKLMSNLRDASAATVAAHSIDD